MKLAREHCMRRLVSDALSSKCHEIVIESDESVVILERKQLAQWTQSRIAYRHEEPHQEPALWISDAIGWAFRRGGSWKQRALQLGLEQIQVD